MKKLLNPKERDVTFIIEFSQALDENPELEAILEKFIQEEFDTRDCDVGANGILLPPEIIGILAASFGKYPKTKGKIADLVNPVLLKNSANKDITEAEL